MIWLHGRGKRMNERMDSILTSIKKMLGIDEEYTYFDEDIIIHINTALYILSQMGISKEKEFRIKDKTAKWTDFLESDIKDLDGVKTYVYLKVRLIFDPPSSSAVIDSIKSTISELEFRLNSSVDIPRAIK